MEIQCEDVLTLPNAISTTGLALVLDGSRRIDEPSGLAEVAAGRMLDLADGAVARATGQTSELGATVDALADKVAGLSIIAGEWRKGVAPRTSLAAILIHNALNGIATFRAAKAHPEEPLKSSRAGKNAMFTENIALGAYASGNLLKDSHPSAARTLRRIGHVATFVGVGVFGVKATYDYFGRSKKTHEPGSPAPL